MAVTLTACDSTAPGAAVPACPSQRPRAHGEGGGRESALGKARRLGVGRLETVRGGAGGQEQKERIGEGVEVASVALVYNLNPLILVLQ